MKLKLATCLTERQVCFTLLFVLVLFMLNEPLAAQAPNTLWTKTFGGNLYDVGRSVQQTDDGGYIITGHTNSFGAGVNDVWLIKTDTDGDIMWTKTFGGIYNDEGYSVQQTIDGGYIITGYTRSYGAGGNDVWLIKTDDVGDTLWTNTFGKFSHEYGNSVQQTADGGYIITGATLNINSGYDVYLIKTDVAGDSLWTKTFRGGNYLDEGYSVQQTADGGYIITGVTSRSSALRDIWLIRTNTTGTILWTKDFGGSGDNWSHSVQQTTDGGYIITGETTSFDAGEYDIWLIRTDTKGDTLWTKTFGGIGSDYGYSVQQTTDGGYIITGYTESFGFGGFDAWLIRTDTNGDALWTKTFGGISPDFGYSVQQTADGGYIITGYTISFGKGGDIYLIKVAADNITAIDEMPESVINDYRLLQNYPNPFNTNTKIKYTVPSNLKYGMSNVTLKVFNFLGNEIATLVNEEKPAGTYEIEFNTQLTTDNKPLLSGFYFCRLQTENFSETIKMLYLK